MGSSGGRRGEKRRVGEEAKFIGRVFGSLPDLPLESGTCLQMFGFPVLVSFRPVKEMCDGKELSHS